MSKTNPTTTDNPLTPEAVADFREWLRSQTPEELAERLTTCKPGVPHYWRGQPVEPITKEDLLATTGGVKEAPIHNEEKAPTEREKAEIR